MQICSSKIFFAGILSFFEIRRSSITVNPAGLFMRLNHVFFDTPVAIHMSSIDKLLISIPTLIFALMTRSFFSSSDTLNFGTKPSPYHCVNKQFTQNQNLLFGELSRFSFIKSLIIKTTFR